jgi:hypothetical protein
MSIGYSIICGQTKTPKELIHSASLSGVMQVKFTVASLSRPTAVGLESKLTGNPSSRFLYTSNLSSNQ